MMYGNLYLRFRPYKGLRGYLQAYYHFRRTEVDIQLRSYTDYWYSGKLFIWQK